MRKGKQFWKIRLMGFITRTASQKYFFFAKTVSAYDN